MCIRDSSKPIAWKAIEEARNEAKVAEVLQLPPINQIGRPVQILNSFGSKTKYLQAVRDLEREIYKAA